MLLLTVLLAISGGIGCDRDRDEAPSPSPDKTGMDGDFEATRTAPLAGIPDFELPRDWLDQHPTLSPNAKLETHWIALADLEATRDPRDGQGRAKLVRANALRSGDDETIRVGDPARFEILFEVGAGGIDEGGLLFVAAETSWEWSEAQTGSAAIEGYTVARTEAEGVLLTPLGPGAAFRVDGRALAAGERVTFVYGAGHAGARADAYAERRAEILIAVDANGDGVRRLIDDSARVEIHARPGTLLIAHGPAESAPGRPIEIRIALTDVRGNRAAWPSASIRDDGLSHGDFELFVLDASTLGLEDVKANGAGVRRSTRTAIDAPHRITIEPSAGTGTLRLRLVGRGAFEGFESTLPPIVVRDAERRLVWGDLHGHSQLSDGTGTPEDYFRYARDVAHLDVAALTDHDHFGARPLDTHPELARAAFDATNAFDRPERFVTLPGYEWTSWLHGHRHVLYFDSADGTSRPTLFSSVEAETDRPDELWAALRGKNVLTFAHHSAGEPVATNWAFPPDPALEPVTEIASVHGQSESIETPVALRGGLPGYFVLDTLRHGYRLGFIGSGDSHDGHPGLAQLAAGRGGLAGLFTQSLDRAAVKEALGRRSTFATNGIRPWLEVSLDDVPMGGELRAGAPSAEHRLRIRYEGTAPLDRVELVRSGRVATLDAAGALSFDLDRAIPALGGNEFHYVRFIQSDGGMAWSSPIFVNARNDAP